MPRSLVMTWAIIIRMAPGETSMSTPAKLIFLCGKMAAGKTTLARDLAVRENAVLLVQDDFLNALFPGEITDVPAFLDRYTRLKNAACFAAVRISISLRVGSE